MMPNAKLNFDYNVNFDSATISAGKELRNELIDIFSKEKYTNPQSLHAFLQRLYNTIKPLTAQDRDAVLCEFIEVFNSEVEKLNVMQGTACTAMVNAIAEAASNNVLDVSSQHSLLSKILTNFGLSHPSTQLGFYQATLNAAVALKLPELLEGLADTTMHFSPFWQDFDGAVASNTEQERREVFEGFIGAAVELKSEQAFGWLLNGMGFSCYPEDFQVEMFEQMVASSKTHEGLNVLQKNINALPSDTLVAAAELIAKAEANL